MPRNRGCSQSHLQLSLLYYHHKQLQFNELTNSTHADLRMAHVTGPTVIATQLDPRPFAPHPIAVPGERCSPGSLCNWIPGPGITPKIAILGCLESPGSDCNWIQVHNNPSLADRDRYRSSRRLLSDPHRRLAHFDCNI